MKYIADSLRNLVAGLGTDRDKSVHSIYVDQVWSDQQLMAAYRNSWLPRKIVDVPAQDCFRRWRSWQADKDAIERIEAEERRLGIRRKLFDAMRKARLFGGAAVYISTGDADVAQPLSVENVRRIRFVNVIMRRQLQGVELVKDPESPYYGRFEFYRLNGSVLVHASRLIVFRGAELPDEELGVSPYGQGWGDSVLQAAIDAIRNVDSTAANIASLVFEAKVDVIRVPDLMASLGDDLYRSRLLERFQLAAQSKGINGSLLLDKDEEYDQKSANFSNMPDLLWAFMQLVSGAADIPATRLLGQSPAGLSSTGESDLRNYYDRVQSMQENEVQPELALFDDCLIRSALGTRPPEVHYIWSSLWQVSDKERAEIGERNAKIIETLNNTGLIPAEALSRAAVNMMVEASVMPGLDEAVDEAVTFADADAKTLYVRRDVINADEIAAWYREQGVAVDDGLHVTVIYSPTPVDWFKIPAAWEAKIELPAGGARDHAVLGENALVLLIKSNELDWRHDTFKSAGCTSNYEEYQPHVTLDYDGGRSYDLASLKPWVGPVLLGPEIFEEVKWVSSGD